MTDAEENKNIAAAFSLLVATVDRGEDTYAAAKAEFMDAFTDVGLPMLLGWTGLTALLLAAACELGDVPPETVLELVGRWIAEPD